MHRFLAAVVCLMACVCLGSIGGAVEVPNPFGQLASPGVTMIPEGSSIVGTGEAAAVMNPFAAPPSHVESRAIEAVRSMDLFAGRPVDVGSAARQPIMRATAAPTVAAPITWTYWTYDRCGRRCVNGRCR